MNRKTPEQRLRELEDRQREIDRKAREEKARIAKMKRREQAKIRSQKRKDETRRKILVGAMYLERFEDDPSSYQRMLDGLKKFLTRDQDRELFGLLPVPNQIYQGETEQKV